MSRFVSILIAMGFLLAIVLWFTFGSTLQQELQSADVEAGITPPPPLDTSANARGGTEGDTGGSTGFGQELEPFSVIVRNFSEKNSSFNLRLHGRSQANRTLNVRAELQGTIETVLVDEGEAVQQNDVLLRIKDTDQSAALRRAQIAYEVALSNYEASQKVSSQGYESRLATLAREAELRAAEQNLQSAQNIVDHLVVRAPFDGVVQTRSAEQGGVIRTGETLVTLLETDPLEVVFYVSDDQYRAVRLGNNVRVEMINGEVRDGVITFVSAASTDNTYTYEVRARIANPNATIPVGMSANVFVLVEGTSAHEIPQGLLTLDAKGNLIVRGVNNDNTVINYNVRIVRQSEGDRVWVVGLPTTVDLIVAGQDFVLPDQTVLVERVNTSNTSTNTPS